MSTLLADQLAQALNSITSNGTPFILQSLDLSSTSSNTIKSNLPKDYSSLLKELNEINRLLKDCAGSWETVFEYLNLLETGNKAEAIVTVIQAKQHDLPEKALVQLLNLTLAHFENLQFSTSSKVDTTFAQSIFSNKGIVTGFTLLAALTTTSVTKNALIKELRRQPVQQMEKLLEVILVLLKNMSISYEKVSPLQPSFEQVCEWVEVLVDAYYLNFCLKEDWKDILEKIDSEIESRNELYELTKAFTESCQSYEKCKRNIQKAVNKIDSKFYVKSMYL